MRYRTTAERSRGTVRATLLTAALLTACAQHNAPAQHAPLSRPTPPCDRDAQALTVEQADFPDEARAKGIHEAQVAIAVDIAANGRLKRARIMRSSGDGALDASALAAAARSTYLPATRHCKPVAGSYMFTVTFSGNS